MPRDRPPRFTTIQGGRAAEVQPGLRSLRDRQLDEEKPFARDHLLKSLGREPTEEEIHRFASERKTRLSGASAKVAKDPPDER